VKARASQAVKKGETLFTLQSPEWDALAAETRIMAGRLEALAAAGARDAALQMQHDTNAARMDAALRLATRDEAAGVFVVAAREDCHIETVSQDSGAWCGVGTEVARAARRDGVWFRADGTLRDAARVRDGMRGWVEHGASRAEGTVEVGWAGDDAARVRPVYLMPNTPLDGNRMQSNAVEKNMTFPLPGTPGILRVVVEEGAAEGVAVPVAAVVEEGLKRVVFVALPTGRMEKRKVVPGVGDGAWVEVAGVSAGERVVVDGVHQLKAAAPSQGGAPAAKAAGHFHADGVYYEDKH
jgi:hypothetical protein